MIIIIVKGIMQILTSFTHKFEILFYFKSIIEKEDMMYFFRFVIKMFLCLFLTKRYPQLISVKVLRVA